MIDIDVDIQNIMFTCLEKYIWINGRTEIQAKGQVENIMCPVTQKCESKNSILLRLSALFSQLI